MGEIRQYCSRPERAFECVLCPIPLDDEPTMKALTETARAVDPETSKAEDIAHWAVHFVANNPGARQELVDKAMEMRSTGKCTNKEHVRS